MPHSTRIRDNQEETHIPVDPSLWIQRAIVSVRSAERRPCTAAPRTRRVKKKEGALRGVLLTIPLVVKFLPEHNIVFFCDSNSKFYQDNNVNFLGLVKMMAEFDPAINDDKIHDHCLGPFI